MSVNWILETGHCSTTSHTRKQHHFPTMQVRPAWSTVKAHEGCYNIDLHNYSCSATFHITVLSIMLFQTRAATAYMGVAALGAHEAARGEGWLTSHGVAS